VSPVGTLGKWPSGSEQGFIKVDSRRLNLDARLPAITLLMAHLNDLAQDGFLAGKLRILQLKEHGTEVYYGAL
jgi:hypothetical protein